MSSGRRGGPISGVIRMLGTGVGAAAEYREHRKEQKLSRENSRQSEGGEASSSGNTPQRSPAATPASEAPPAYTDVVTGTSDRSVASGKPATDDKKAALAQYDEDSSTDDDDVSSIEDDEEDWRLDDLQHIDSAELPSYGESEKLYGNTDELVQQVVRRNTVKQSSPTQQPFIHQPIPCPVVIPQRRPRNKTRGFIRAYAPLLGECSGIDQDTFLAFLENFYKSSQASPVFGVIELSAAIAGFAPEPITMAVTTAVQVAARTGEELQSRYRTNQFLNKMNDEMFKPAGLYAMIVKYKSDAEVQASANSLLARFGVAASTVDFNTNQTIAKYNRTGSSESTGSHGMSDKMKNLRLASGTTRGTINLPAAAPLIFPDVDKAIATEGPETFKDKAKDAQSFLADYMDRRAHVKYANSDPNSTLIVPESERQFKSKLADPEHPMFNSGPIGFVTGGYLAKQRGGYTKRDYREERRIDKYERRMDTGRGLSRKKQRRYDAYMYNQGYGPDEQYSYEARRRPRGPIGLAVNLVGAGVSAATSKGKNKETEGSSVSVPAPQAAYGRRSFDERRGYEGGYGNQPAPPAEYGRRSFDDRRTPYDSKSALAPSESAPAAYGGYSNTGAGYPARRRPVPRRAGGGPIGMVKRIMTEDVLYLMIVNMPSEEEMAAAREKLEAAKAGK